jgi:hypothetical protein
MKQRFSTPFQTDVRKKNSSQVAPSLNVQPEQVHVIQTPAPPEPEPLITRKNLEGKVVRYKKTKLEELNSHTMNSQGEVVSFIQAYFPK